MLLGNQNCVWMDRQPTPRGASRGKKAEIEAHRREISLDAGQGPASQQTHRPLAAGNFM